MTQDTPSKEQNILQELFAVPYTNVMYISARESQLEDIIKEDADNVSALLALLQAKIMLGKAEEGIALALRIWETGGQITKDEESLFIYQLNSLGMFSKSLALLKPKISLYQSARREYKDLKQALLRCAVGLGDLDLISKMAQLEEFAEEHSFLDAFALQMEKANLKQHFMKQQQLIEKLIYGKVAGYEVGGHLTKGYPQLEVALFVGGDSVDRYQLQQTITETFREYYGETKVDILDNFNYSIFYIQEHWSMNDANLGFDR